MVFRLSSAFLNSHCNVISYKLNLYLYVTAYTARVKLMVSSILLQASERVAQNLESLRSNQTLENFSNLSTIAKNVCDNGGLVHVNPLNF